MSKIEIIADTHCHTIASSHAYSTVMENVEAAKKRGLFAIAITDHGKNMPNSPGKWYFKNLICIPKFVNGVRVLKGIEANVIDYDGNLDDDREENSELEWMIASIHDYSIKGEGGIEACTNAWLEVAKNPLVNVIGHCGVEKFKFDYEKVIPEFGANGKVVEINNNSFYIRKDAIKNCLQIAKLCKKYGVRVVVNSDAHFCLQVGVFDNAVKMLEEIDFPKELIINSSRKNFENYLEERGIL